MSDGKIKISHLPSGKIVFELPQDISAWDAFLSMSLALIGEIRKYLKDLNSSSDIEVLHNLRVESRRLRTLLTKIKGVLPEKIADDSDQIFAKIAKGSNKVRDFDVLLDSFEVYVKDIDKKRAGCLDKILSQIRLEREKAFSDMITALSDAEERLSKAEEFLSSAAGGAELSTRKAALRAIRKKIKKINKLSSEIGKKSDEKFLHRLRISCKHLRYLIELFASLFKKKTVNNVLKKLKQVQDLLGIYHDTCIQSSYIDSLRNSHFSSDEEVKEILSDLLDIIEKRKRKMKKKALKEIEKFIEKGLPEF